jgi:putative inorganic carbon (HCO3(-)) transporter
VENDLDCYPAKGRILTRAFIQRQLPWLQIIWLIIWTPLLLFITTANGWWLLSIPVLWLVAWLVRGYPLPRTPLNVSIGLIAGLTFLSLLITPDQTLSLPKVAGLFLGLAWFFAIVDLSHIQRGIAIITGGLIGAVQALSGLAIFVIQWLDKNSILAAITSKLPHLTIELAGLSDGLHPNEVAGALLWVFPLCVVLAVGLLKAHNALRRWGIVTGLISLWLLFVLLLTQSRSAWFGIGVAGVTLLAVLNRSLRRIFIVLTVLALVGTLIATPDRVGKWLFGESTEIVAGTSNWSFRLEVWRVAVAGVVDFPFTGMGIGTFEETSRLLYGLDVSPDYHFGHAHNEFFQAALDLGLPGLIAFIAIHLIAFGMLFKILTGPAATRSLISLLALGSGSGLLAHLIYGLTDATALGSRYGLLFWCLLGLIASLFQQHSKLTASGLVNSEEHQPSIAAISI